MQVRHALIAAAASTIAVACSQAVAATPDPSKDLDCSVITFYFSGLAKHRGAEVGEQQALASVFDWYRARVKGEAGAENGDAMLSRAAPILEAVKRDPMNMRDELAACTDRAVREGLG